MLYLLQLGLTVFLLYHTFFAFGEFEKAYADGNTNGIIFNGLTIIIFQGAIVGGWLLYWMMESIKKQTNDEKKPESLG